MGFAIGYSIFLCILAIIVFVIAIKAFLKKELFGTVLGIECLLTFLATATYLASALSTDLNIVKITANTYFASISLILAAFVFINTLFTNKKFNKYRILIFVLIAAYAVYESVLFPLNIKYGFAVNFVPSTYGAAPYFVYEMHTAFYLHLAYSYLVVAIIFFQLIRCIVKIPSGYRKAYVSVLIGLSIVILVNAIFLFIPSNHVVARFDISLPGYFALIALVYWAHYYFTKNGLISIYKNFIMNNSEQGFVMFNHERNLVYYNDNAKKMLIGIEFNEELTLRNFIITLGLDPARKVYKKPTTSQIIIRSGEIRRSLRMSSSALFNKHDQPIGYLFRFTNTEFESDILTSFESNAAFIAKINDEGNIFSNDMTLSILDINNLGTINAQNGYAEGDAAIQDLSNLMRKYFPQRSYFVRGREASLVVFSEGLCEEDALEICKTISTYSKYAFQYAVTIARGNEKLSDAMTRVCDSLNTIKVMDPSSQRSGSLNSLIKALQEVDSDTMEHVKRTQNMAEKLANKLKLNQVEKNNLLLLSILHDIGKISVPLEILNKPTKLTDDEWKVIQSHVTKGYNIAMSSPLLKCIATEILYHHERWDGKGYPEGLKGEEIPLLSRIVSIVDSYDAMVSDRVYRHGMSTGAAIQELIRCSGTQFDPTIVKEFVEILETDDTVYGTTEKADVKVKEKVIRVKKSENVNSLSFSRYTIANGNDITYIDSNFTQITGYTQADVEKGLTQLDLIPTEDRLFYADMVKKTMAQSNTVVVEHRLQKKDGTIITVFCYGKKYFNSAAREFRDEIMVFDTANSKIIKDYLDSQQTTTKK